MSRDCVLELVRRSGVVRVHAGKADRPTRILGDALGDEIVRGVDIRSAGKGDDDELAEAGLVHRGSQPFGLRLAVAGDVSPLLEHDVFRAAVVRETAVDMPVDEPCHGVLRYRLWCGPGGVRRGASVIDRGSTEV